MTGRLKDYAKIVNEDPAVDHVVAFAGGGTANAGRMFVSLKPMSVRKISADQIIAGLRGKLSRIPGATLFLQAVQDVRVGGRSTNAQYQYTLQSEDLNALTEWTPKLYAKMRSLSALADVNSDQQTRGLQASLVIDRETASRLGISSQLADDTLYDAFGQRQVSTMYTPLNQYHVVMEVAPKFWQDPTSLRYIYVRTSNGPPWISPGGPFSCSECW